MGRVGIYARISLDRRDGEGVARQLADCREIAKARWPDAEVVEYVDNDISAFRAKRRPEYERLLDDLRAKRLSAVVAYHPDRLYRRPADLESFIDAVQAAGAEVATVRAGDVDLSTASGRMVARILGAVSRQESERIGERVARAKHERARQGRAAGGGLRPFGLTADRTAVVEDEARVLREVADAILAGRSWRSQVDRLNAEGMRTTAGNQWTIGTLRRTLTSPYVAGLRSYRGEIVGATAWPAIIDQDTWELLRAGASARRRPGRPPKRQRLLSGLLACCHCGSPLYVGQASRRRGDVYRCAKVARTDGTGCGRLTIAADLADRTVSDTVADWLQHPTFLAELDAWLAYGDEAAAEALAELSEIERQQVVLAQRWADGKLPDAAYEAAVATLARRQAEVEARLDGRARASASDLTGADIAAAWEALTTDERREVISLVATIPIVVTPGRDDQQRVVPAQERLQLRPAWDPNP